MFIPNIFSLKITWEQEFLHWLQPQMRLISSRLLKNGKGIMTTNKSNKYFSGILLNTDFYKFHLWFEHEQLMPK